MNCAICKKPLGDTTDPSSLFFNDEGFIICQACSHHGGGIILEDEVEGESIEDDPYGFAGDWWKGEKDDEIRE